MIVFVFLNPTTVGRHKRSKNEQKSAVAKQLISSHMPYMVQTNTRASNSFKQNRSIMTFKSYLTFIVLILILQSCGDGTATQEKGFNKSLENMNGVYVSEGYESRDDGTDWMAITVIPINETQAQVNIRSRVDNDKAATCTYASLATAKENNILEALLPENKSVLFAFSNKEVTISNGANTEVSFLQSFCMEGKSIAGSYSKLSEPLDDAQLLEGGFVKKLSMKDITFKIQASSAGSSNPLTIIPSGLTGSNQKVVTEIKGFIVDAQIADLNNDSWPELLLFIDLGKNKKTGTVLAYTTTGGKTMSLIEYPNTFDLKKAGDGYMGQDKFDIKGNKLVQEFPIHTPDGKLTGKTRQVWYEFVHENNSQFFEVDKVTDN